MSTPLPERLDPQQMADAGGELAGPIEAARLARLRGAVLDFDEVTARLVFRRDPGGRCLVEGTAATRARMRCQRCLEPVELPLEAAFRLALIRDGEQEERLPEDLEPLQLERRLLDPAELVEDELLLALPVVARHERIEDCGPRARYLEEQPEEPPQTDKRENPFAALGQLKKH